MTLEFQTAHQCVEDLMSKVWKVPYGHGLRPKEKQVQCLTCMRWKYGDERCNLFSTASRVRTTPNQETK